MILGSDAIVISRKEAEKILEAIRLNWNKATVKRLIKIDALRIIDGLRVFVNEGYDD